LSDASINAKSDTIIYNIRLAWPSTYDSPPDELNFIFKRETGHSSEFSLIQSDMPAMIAKWENVYHVLEAENSLFIAYMAGRFIAEDAHILQNARTTSSQTAAFDNAFNRTIDYAATLAWFNNMDADEARAMRDNAGQMELPELKAVRYALAEALLGQYERPRMKGSPPELIINKKGTDITYKVSQLSDGYRAMLALVMDLARRMALAHGAALTEGESILHSPAIVLIDEVELHLHPSWQQTVLTTLMDIFRGTQFIVTTHSPQVLTSIPAKHIRILSEGKAYTVDDQTEGAEAQRLLKQVFGVDPRPLSLSIVQDLNDYTKLVYAEKWDTPDAEELRERLTAHFGSGEPRLMELDLHIENSKWERGL
jgi:predicted ATP-binding protein involved in virulence